VILYSGIIATFCDKLRLFIYVLVATAWTFRGSNPDRGQDIFLFLKIVQTVSGAHPAPLSLSTLSFPRFTWLGRKVNHSLPSTVEIENEWI
jgi:hypothetical protein